jgi:hypothetical protein
MTEELRKAIEGLYQTFSIYPFKSKMDGCPCCVSALDKEKIHTKQLRELSEEDLSRYAFKAMTTWGDTEDFKHYLPRIFELLATTDFIVDTFVVLGKLDYGKWRTWPGNEQTVLTEFLLAWWTDSIKNKSYFDKEAFIEIFKLIGNIDYLLERWKINFKDKSFLNYIDLVHDYYYDLISKRTGFKDLNDKSIDKLTSWIKINSEFIEKGFFHYIDQDKDIADKISTTLYIFDHNK